MSHRLRLLKPLGFFDFVRLEREARAVMSDSGTVQEECAIFRVPNVTIRDVTERPETIECGSNILSGADSEDVERAMSLVLSLPDLLGRAARVPTCIGRQYGRQDRAGSAEHSAALLDRAQGTGHRAQGAGRREARKKIATKSRSHEDGSQDLRVVRAFVANVCDGRSPFLPCAHPGPCALCPGPYLITFSTFPVLASTTIINPPLLPSGFEKLMYHVA